MARRAVLSKKAPLRTNSDDAITKHVADPAIPVRGKIHRNPDNPFEAFDENGLPILPLTIDDDSPSHGIRPGGFGNTDPNTGRSIISSLVARLNWNL